MKMIKFDLPIDGIKVATMEQLRRHFTTEVVEHFRTGVLAKWLRSRDATEALASLESIEAGDGLALFERLCCVFEIDFDVDSANMAFAAPTGRSLTELTKAFDVPKEVLGALVPLVGATDGADSQPIANTQIDLLVRHLVDARLRNCRPIGVGETKAGTIIAPESEEIWMIVIPDPCRVRVWTSGDLDTVGLLTDRFGQGIDVDDDSGDGTNFSMSRGFDRGVYFLTVSAYRKKTGDYRLHVD